MKKIKNIVTLLCIALLFAKPLNVNAEELTKVVSNSENNIRPCDFSDLAGAYELPQNVGESIIVDEDENGTLKITLVYESQSMTRDNTSTRYKTFTFSRENIFGVTETVFEVNLECDWVIAGEDSYIVALRGNYNILKNGYSCNWSDSSYSKTICSLTLDATSPSGSHTYVFYATILPREDIDSDDLHFYVFD